MYVAMCVQVQTTLGLRKVDLDMSCANFHLGVYLQCSFACMCAS